MRGGATGTHFTHVNLSGVAEGNWLHGLRACVSFATLAETAHET